MGLIHACMIGNLEIVQLLLDKGADFNIVNIAGNSALSHAVINNEYEIVYLLLEIGTTLETINEQGFSPLKISIRKGDLKMTKLFLDCCYQDDDIYDILYPYLTYAWSFCYGLEGEFDGGCVNDENGDRKKILNKLQ